MNKYYIIIFTIFLLSCNKTKPQAKEDIKEEASIVEIENIEEEKEEWTNPNHGILMLPFNSIEYWDDYFNSPAFENSYSTLPIDEKLEKYLTKIGYDTTTPRCHLVFEAQNGTKIFLIIQCRGDYTDSILITEKDDEFTSYFVVGTIGAEELLATHFSIEKSLRVTVNDISRTQKEDTREVADILASETYQILDDGTIVKESDIKPVKGKFKLAKPMNVTSETEEFTYKNHNLKHVEDSMDMILTVNGNDYTVSPEGMGSFEHLPYELDGEYIEVMGVIDFYGSVHWVYHIKDGKIELLEILECGVPDPEATGVKKATFDFYKKEDNSIECQIFYDRILDSTKTYN